MLLHMRGHRGIVKIDKAGDLIYMTYYMIDWDKVGQKLSDQKCVQCGAPMKEVEPAVDSKGSRYNGLVCHACRRVIWAKSA